MVKNRTMSILIGFLLLMCPVLADTSVAYAEGGVLINETNFPDLVFREYVSGFDTDEDGELSDSEISVVKQIKCSFRGIKTLEGIKYFTALRSLYCDHNSISTLDVSQNRELEILNCNLNNLEVLNLENNAQLWALDFSGNNISSIDVSFMPRLFSLGFYCNNLTSLNVSQNRNLQMLDCSNNNLSELDVSQNKLLFDLRCDRNPLSTLDVSRNKKLKTLKCAETGLHELDISHNPKIFWLECGYNHMTQLDITHNPILRNTVNNGIYHEPTDGIKGYVLLDQQGEISSSFECDIETQIIQSEGNVYEFDAEIAAIPDQTYTGSAITPQIHVTATLNGAAYPLQEGHDYTVKYSNNVNAGRASVTVTLQGEHPEEITEKFTIVPADIGACDFGSIKAMTYTGNALTPKPDVSHNGRPLAEGDDYEVVYANNTNAGTAKITVTGRGNYTGNKEFSFIINKANGTITAASSYTKAYGSPDFALGAKSNGGGTLTYRSSNTNVAAVTSSGKVTVKRAGICTVIVKSAETSNYKAASKTVSIRVNPAKAKISNVKSGKKMMTVRISKKASSYGASAFQIAYREKGASKWKYTTTSQRSKAINKLKKGKIYEVRVRACSKQSGGAYYGEWSNTYATKKIR